MSSATLEEVGAVWKEESLAPQVEALGMDTAALVEMRSKLKGKLRAYRRDPLRFVRQVLKVQRITKQQKKVLRAVAQDRAKVCIASGRGIGKTALLAWCILWFLCCFPRACVACTAPTSAQLKSVLWKEVRVWYGNMNPFFQRRLEIQEHKILVKGGATNKPTPSDTSFAVARTARKGEATALQGFHAPNFMLLVDEAPGVHDEDYNVSRFALTDANVRQVLTGNPHKLSGFFYDAHHSAPEAGWTKFNFSSENSPNVDSRAVEEIAEEYGRDSDYFRVHIRGLFPRASAQQLIADDWVREAMRRKIRRRDVKGLPKVFGVDVARYGPDKSAIVYRVGNFVKILGIYKNFDAMQLAEKIVHFAKIYKPHMIFVDIGKGEGVVDRVHQLGYPVTEVYFGGGSSSPKYINKRTEMWWTMRKWIRQGGALPSGKAGELLRRDLTSLEYYAHPSDKLAVERKEDAKNKRGVKSPDVADALACTFAAPVILDDDDTDISPTARGARSRRYFYNANRRYAKRCA
jgi:hypothetical protein